MHPMETETLNLAPRDAGDRFMDASMVTSLPVRGNGSLAGHTSPKLEAGSNLDAVLSFRFEVPDRSLLGAASGGNKSSTLSAVASGSCMRDSDHFASSCAQAGRKTAPGFDDDVPVDAIRTPRGHRGGGGNLQIQAPPCPWSRPRTAANERHHSSSSAFFFTPPSARDRPRNNSTSIRIHHLEPLHRQTRKDG